MNEFVEWEFERDGETVVASVFYTVGSWVPYDPGTYWQPPEGGYFEDICFDRAEDEDGRPLTPAEMIAAEKWFDHDGWEIAQNEAIDHHESMGAYE